MPADGPPGLVDNHARGRAEVVQQEVVELKLAEKTDALFRLCSRGFRGGGEGLEIKKKGGLFNGEGFG